MYYIRMIVDAIILKKYMKTSKLKYDPEESEYRYERKCGGASGSCIIGGVKYE